MSSTCPEGDAVFPPTLVIGASGRLGCMLHDHWQHMPATWASRTQTMHGVVTQYDPDSLAQLARSRQVSTLLCLAGVVPGSGDLDANAHLAVSAIEAAALAGVKTVLLCSSAAVYGRSDHRHRETDNVQPESAYGAAKLRMEDVGLELGHKRNVTVCNLRIGNIAGADALLSRAKTQQRFVLDRFGDHTTPLRSYLGPSGFARCLQRIIENAAHLPDILNVALPQPVYMSDLLDRAGLPWSPKPADVSAIQRVVLDTQHLSRLVDFEAMDDPAQHIVDDWRQWESRGTAR